MGLFVTDVLTTFVARGKYHSMLFQLSFLANKEALKLMWGQRLSLHVIFSGQE